MKLLTKCQSCKRFSVVIWKRIFTHKIAGRITSQSEMCGRCARSIGRAMKSGAI